jgi:hypothetical protein
MHRGEADVGAFLTPKLIFFHSRAVSLVAYRYSVIYWGGRRISPQELDRNVTANYSTLSVQLHPPTSYISGIEKGQTYTKDSDATDDSGVLGRGKSVIGGADNTLGSTARSRLNDDALGGHCGKFGIGIAWEIEEFY